VYDWTFYLLINEESTRIQSNLAHLNNITSLGSEKLLKHHKQSIFKENRRNAHKIEHFRRHTKNQKPLELSTRPSITNYNAT